MHLRTEGNHQFAEIDHAQLLQASHLGKVVVGREQGATGVGGELEQLLIGALALVAGAVDHQPPAILLAQAREQLQPAAPFSPLFVVAGVGQGLQLINHGLGDDHLPLQQPRSQQPLDSPINDHAGVEDLGGRGLKDALSHQQGVCAGGVEEAQQCAPVHLRQVVPEHPEEHIAQNRRQRLDQDHFPGEGKQQNGSQEQVGHQEAEDQTNGPTDEQICGHAAHLPHQAPPELLEEKPRQQPEEGAEAAEHPAQPLHVGDLQQQAFRQQIHPEPAGGGAGQEEQQQDEDVHHGD